jgi:hypothetical protein
VQWRNAYAAIILFVALGPTPGIGQTAPTQSKPKKNTTMTIDIPSVHLPEDAFWQTGDDHGRDPLPRKYKFSHFGVLVDAPREVVLATRSSLPLFVYFMGTYRQVMLHKFPQGAFLVVMDPDRNILRIAPFVDPSGEDLPTSVSIPDDQIPDGYLATFQALDIKERLRLPWEPGRILSEIVMSDLTSNRVETKLQAGPNVFVDVEKEKFLAGERGKINPPAPYPDLLMTKQEESPDAPPVPEEFGLVLKAPRVTVVDGKTSIFLRASWKLPVKPEELVKPENETYNKAHGLLKIDGFTPLAACVTIHVLIVGSFSQVPQHYQFHLPVATLATGPENPTSTGSFNIDLTKLRNFPLLDQTLFVHAYAKEWAAEPVMIGVVNRIPKE